MTEEQVIEIVKKVFQLNPLAVVYMTVDAAGNEFESDRRDSVILGSGTLRVPPQMIRIREGDERYIIGEALGTPMRVKIEGLGVGNNEGISGS
ncbi:MAG TPA: hypothetical protein VMX74_13210 [Pirellulales bacterium]|nr:hypothetical protein [Pirellulales bacterium]